MSSLPQPPAAYRALNRRHGQPPRRPACSAATVWRRNYLVWRKYLFDRVLLVGYGAVCYYIALVMTRRRLLK